jgi:two-component system phosphate regulon sensor histidine kinase PhoR
VPRRRLLWQIYPAYLLITVLALGAVGWFASREARQLYLARTAEDLAARAWLVEPEVRARLAAGDGAAVDALCKGLDPQAATRITVILPGGRVVGDSEESPAAMASHADRPEVAAAFAGAGGSATRYSATLHEDMMYVAVPVRQDGRVVAVVRTAIPLTHVDRALRIIYLQIGLGGLAVAVLAAAAGLVVYRRMSRPLEEIRQGAERLARGELEARLPVSGAGEAGRLAEALNQMAERLRRLERLRREFVANVSHELKTPITSIKGFVETLQDGALESPEDARKFLEIVARHADRLDSIIGDLLLLSRLEQDAEGTGLELETAQLREVLRAAAEACAVKADAKQIKVYLECPVDFPVRVSPPLLEQAVVNLIDNAIKYSEPGAPVYVEGARAGAEAVVTVRDRGCGIDAEHLPRLGERFYRVDKARSRQQGGTGLGLAIVKHIAQAHGGRVTVESVPGEGSVFHLHLPAERSEA